jgi:hypothetical protein
VLPVFYYFFLSNFFVCLRVLNLLLSTIILDHKESKKEVMLNNIIFMAKYAIWLDFSRLSSARYF